MKRLAVFDFDGTLFDSVEDVVNCFNEALTMHDFPILTREEYIERLGGNIDQAVSLILKDQNTPENIELIKDAYEKLYDASPKDNSIPFPNVHEVLKELQENGIVLAINSNRKTESIRYYIDRFLTDIDFAAVEGHNPDYPSKPSPFAVNKIRKKLNMSKEDTIYIGDSSTDIKTARNAQVDCVIVKWGYGNQDDYDDEYPVYVIDYVCELLELLL